MPNHNKESKQKLTVEQQNNRLAIGNVFDSNGAENSQRLAILANQPDSIPVKKPRKSRFDTSTTDETKEEPKEEARGRTRKRKSRWAKEDEDKVVVPGMSTNIPSKLTAMQKKCYMLQLQIEDCTRRLRTSQYGIPDDPDKRSPSPEPIYDANGKRLNTREYRWKRKVQNHRHACITKLLMINPEYRPPTDYKAPETKLQERIEIPQVQFPQINFVGLLIGPRGLTLKKLERESGARIMIRGKGSVKESKLITGKTYAAFDEPLHALVSAPTDEVLKKAVAMVTSIVKTAVENPDGEQDLRKLQVMELAKLNGTLRGNIFNGLDWLKEENSNLVNATVCTVCGGRGHLATDCRQARPGTTHNMRRTGTQFAKERKHLDSEYQALMNELGETTSAPLQMAVPQLGTGTSQMATHSIGGVNVQAAIENKPSAGMPTSNDYGYGDNDDFIQNEDLGSGAWDSKQFGQNSDYTMGPSDSLALQDHEKAITLGNKKKKSYGQADPEGTNVNSAQNKSGYEPGYRSQTYGGLHISDGPNQYGKPNNNYGNGNGNRPVKHGMGYMSENPNASRKDRITPRHHNYNRNGQNNSYGFVPKHGHQSSYQNQNYNQNYPPTGQPVPQPMRQKTQLHQEANYQNKKGGAGKNRHYTMASWMENVK